MNEATLQEILPATTQQAVGTQLIQDFKSTLKLPKGMNRQMVARAVDYMLLKKKTVEQAQHELGLVASEAEYVGKVVEEFKAWDAAKSAPIETPATKEG